MNTANSTAQSLYFLRRVFARLLDFLSVELFSSVLTQIFPHASVHVLVLYSLYNILAATTKGKTIGRYACSLKINSTREYRPSAILLLLRELFFLVLFPLIVFSLLSSPQILLHDRICHTQVMKEDG